MYIYIYIYIYYTNRPWRSFEQTIELSEISDTSPLVCRHFVQIAKLSPMSQCYFQSVLIPMLTISASLHKYVCHSCSMGRSRGVNFRSLQQNRFEISTVCLFFKMSLYFLKLILIVVICLYETGPMQ